MAIFKCKMCGGTLEINNETVAVCEYCGTQQTLPKTTDEVVSNLFNRANNLRLKCEFDKAAQIYEKIVEQDDSEAEAHWGLVLCKYGIEYVEDPKTHQRIPTCHRTLFEAVTTDTDYQAAIDYSDAAQQSVYEKEARAIDKIQKDILSIVKNEKPFDVFICYKETDASGKRTVDSAIANDIYHQLTQEGFKVFYAAITLEDKLGQEYEPYIFAALNSAKVMLVLGTNPEFFNAVWVKNEWSRFLQLMKSDRSKLLIPCYRDMDAYDLPEEFAHLQAQDMGKIGFINDVIRGIKKIAKTEEPKVSVIKETTVQNNGTMNIAPLLERAFLFAEDGEWDSANEYCEKVLDLDPKNANAYLGKLLAELKVKTPDGLKDCAQPFDSSSNYQKALRFSDEKLRVSLAEYIEHIKNRNEMARLEGIYGAAELKMITGTENSLREAAKAFESIRKYKDSEAKVKECYEKAESARKDKILAEAKDNMQGDEASSYRNSILLLKTISGWKNADELIDVCSAKIAELDAKAVAERLEQERQAEIARKEAEEKAKRNKKIAIIATKIICAVIAFIIVLNIVIIVLNTVIIPNAKYNDAIALMEDGNIIEAYEALIALDGYKDSADKANSIYGKYKVKKLKGAKVGDCVFFGAYEQDNNTSNGTENVEWLVLEVKDGKALVISKYALNCKPYNTIYTEITWETCTLRKWLNNDFINAAFSSDEKAVIPTVTVSADKNSVHSTNPGNATQDQVFLLSITEANKYFSSDRARQCKPTDYAIANGAYVNIDNSNCGWWLRTPGGNQSVASCSYNDGDVFEYGLSVKYSTLCVRPALWIDLNVD